VIRRVFVAAVAAMDDGRERRTREWNDRRKSERRPLLAAVGQIAIIGSKGKAASEPHPGHTHTYT